MRFPTKHNVMVFGLVLVALYVLSLQVVEGFKSAVELIEPLFYQPPYELQINIPKRSPQGQINYLFGKDAPLAYAIFMAESHLRADAVSSTGDIGCAQINHKAHPQYAMTDLLDCNTNIRIAYTIYKQQGGFQAWSAYKNGSYKKYLIN